MTVFLDRYLDIRIPIDELSFDDFHDFINFMFIFWYKFSTALMPWSERQSGNDWNLDIRRILKLGELWAVNLKKL